MPTSFQYDVFLSHNSKDKTRVRQLAERLKQAGLRVWFDDWSIQFGDIIASKVDEGLEQSRVLILCISQNALDSGWVGLERSTAIHRDPANEGRRFIPLLLTDCNLPDTLRRYKYVDFRQDTAEAFAEVLTACRTDEAGAKSEVQSDSATKPIIKAEVKRGRSEAAKPLAALEGVLEGHRSWVNSVAVSPDGKWAASGSDDKTVRIWDLKSGKCRVALSGHSNQVNSVAVSSDGRKIFSGANDSTIRVWDSKSGESNEIVDIKGKFFVLSLQTVPHQKKLFFVGAGPEDDVWLWDIEREKLGWSCRQRDNSFGRSCAVSPDGKWAVVGNDNSEIDRVDLTSGKLVGTLRGHSEIVRSIQIRSDGRFAVSGSSDQTVKVWDLEAGICVGTLEGHQAVVHAVSLSSDGLLIASTGFTDRTVRIWDFQSGACLQVIKCPASPISVAFSPDGARLLVGTTNAKIYVYRITGAHRSTSNKLALRYVNAKVVLLGEGTVGKTSLAHRLIEDEYVVRDRTHGMKVWRLELPLPPDDTLEREALLWDLAGQEDYRLIHPLFLQETALALLLINPQTDNPLRETGDWLKMLETAVKEQDHQQEAGRLLILSQVDVGGPKLSDGKLELFCGEKGFRGWLTTSSKSGENCSDQLNDNKPSKLKQLISESIPWDKLPWTNVHPPVLAELKNAVVGMRDGQDIRLLRFAELMQRLEQALPDERFGEADVRTAVRLLANHGLVRQLKFGDLVLLQPELINGYAAAIIRAARAHTDEIGCVSEQDIYRPDFDFTGVERLKHRPDEELLLRALVQTLLDHSLCIAEETPKGRHLVFPSQYRREKDIPHDPEIFVSYTFSGEWQTVWTTLVVRLWYSQEFEHKELWRNAAEFASPKGYTLGLKIENQQGEGRATISFYFDREVSDEQKTLFIEYGHRHLARYAAEVARDRRYVCLECGKPVTDLAAVRERLDSKRNFITCQGCDEKVQLIDFIEQRLTSDPVARKILAMDEAATRKLDTQSLEQILIGHMMATAGEANQIFRPTTMFDYGIDGEVEFKDNDGKASGQRIYIQLKSGNSYLRTRKGDGTEVFDVKDERHLDYWVNQPVDVYLVIRQTDERMGNQVIRWMNVTHHLKTRKDKKSRQIVFQGEKLDVNAVWKVRDGFFPPERKKKQA